MIINVLGDTIDTDHIYKVTKVSATRYSSYNNHIEKDTCGFAIVFKASDSFMNINLYGPRLFRDSKIKWEDASAELYYKRLAILKKKVEDLRNSIIEAWVGRDHVPTYDFDVSLPMIDLRKNGVSVEMSKPSGFMPSNVEEHISFYGV